MSIHFHQYRLGPLSTNTYLLYDDLSLQAVIIDPASGSEKITSEISEKNLHLDAIWITHAHFDHYSGVSYYPNILGYDIPIGLHEDDLPLWREGGGSKMFGYHMATYPEPEIIWRGDEKMGLGSSDEIQVLHTPGHSPGHVSFHLPQISALFCGDLLFHSGVGRTDLPGGNLNDLLKSITVKVFSLPAETNLYCGHGPETTICREMKTNSFLV